MRFKTVPRKAYPSDLTDEQWCLLEPLLPPDRTDRLGRPREADLREVVNAILFINRSGCQWDMLPHDLLSQEHGLRLLRPVARRRHVAEVDRRAADASPRRGGTRTDTQRRLHRQPVGEDHRGRRGRAGL